MTDKTDNFYIIHRLIRRLLQKNRFIRKLTHTELSRTELHVLTELQANPSLSITSLVPMLTMNQSSVSRVVQGLAERGLLEVKIKAKDKRQKAILITKDGKAAVAAVDQVSNQMYQQFSERLLKSESDKLANIFQLIADSCNQPATEPRENESKLRSEQRRLSRGFGILSQEILGTALSPNQWHVIAEISRRHHPTNARELGHLLGITPTSLTAILDKFESSGYIKRTVATYDSRINEISATAKGKDFYEKIVQIGIRTIKKALSSLSPKEISELIKLLTKYVGEGDARESILNSLPGNYKAVEIEKLEDRRQARAFMAREIVRRGHEIYLTETLIAAESIVFGLYVSNDQEDVLKAVCEIIPRGKKGILNALCWSSEITLNLLYGFVIRAKDLTEISEGINQLVIEFEPAKSLFK